MNKKIISLIFLFYSLSAFALESKAPLVASINGGGVFSPNGDGFYDEATIKIEIELKQKSEIPFIPLLEIKILNSEGETVNSFVTKELPSLSKFKSFFTKEKNFTLCRELTWDGKNSEEIICPDGNYFVEINIFSDDGQKSNYKAKSFYLDNSAPKVTFFKNGLSVYDNGAKPILSTLNDKSEKLKISHAGEKAKIWQSKLIDEEGTILKEQMLESSELEDFDLSELDSDSLSEEKNYNYTLFASDEVDNKKNYKLNDIKLILSAPITDVKLSASSLFIAPQKDKIAITPIFDKKFLLVGYQYTLANESGEELLSVYKQSSETKTFYLDAFSSLKSQPLAEGFYFLTFKAFYQNDFETTQTFKLYFDTTKAFANIEAEEEPTLFANESEKNSFVISQSSSVEAKWITQICNDSGEIIFSEEKWNISLNDFVFGAKLQDGTMLAEGFYTYKVFAINLVGDEVFSHTISDIAILHCKSEIDETEPSMEYIEQSQSDETESTNETEANAKTELQQNEQVSN